MILFRLQKRLVGILACTVAGVIIGCGGSGGGGSTTSTTVTTASTSSTSGTGWTASTSSTSSTASTASTSSTSSTSGTGATAGDGPALAVGDLVWSGAPNDLWITDGNGENERLHMNLHQVVSAAVSPNRKWVVFSGQPEGEPRGLYAMRVDGTDLQLLVKDSPTDYAASVTMDPSGRYCAYMHNTPGQEGLILSRLSVVDLSTNSKRLLTSGIKNSITALSWDPQDRYIAYASANLATDRTQLFFISTQGGPQTKRNAYGYDFCFSPDGNHLSYITDSIGGDPATLGLYDVNADSNSRLSAENIELPPIFDPTGDYVYTRFRNVEGGYDYYKFDVNTRTKSALPLTQGIFIQSVAGGPR